MKGAGRAASLFSKTKNWQLAVIVHFIVIAIVTFSNRVLAEYMFLQFILTGLPFWDIYYCFELLRHSAIIQFKATVCAHTVVDKLQPLVYIEQFQGCSNNYNDLSFFIQFCQQSCRNRKRKIRMGLSSQTISIMSCI